MPYFNHKCPFHSFLAGGFAFATFFFLSNLISYRFNRKISRYDVDGRFTDTTEYASLVFISGQVGEGSTVYEQTQSALKYVDKALANAGSDKSKILEATVWLTDITRDYDAMNKAYDAWIVPRQPPSRACIQSKLYSPETLVEIRVIAAK